jgi:hypothetical protein
MTPGTIRASFAAMDVLGTGKSLLHLAQKKAREIEEDLKARREVEVEGMVAGVRARLEQRLALVPLPVDGDLGDHKGPLGLGRVRTWAFRAGRLRKIVLSHVAMPPIVEGLALTVIPLPELDFPVFAADLMALPTRVSVNADVYGRELQTRGALLPLLPTFRNLGVGAGPLWAARLGSGRGLHAKLNPRMVDQGFAALTQALSCYLDELEQAAPGRSTEPQTAFFQAFHNNGPRKGPLSRVMGQDWAERYSRLVFE